MTTVCLCVVRLPLPLFLQRLAWQWQRRGQQRPGRGLQAAVMIGAMAFAGGRR
jgi:hypothetical protein